MASVKTPQYDPVPLSSLPSDVQERVQRFSALQVTLQRDGRMALVYELATEHELSLRQIGELLGYSRSNIARWLSDARELVAARSQQAETNRRVVGSCPPDKADRRVVGSCPPQKADSCPPDKADRRVVGSCPPDKIKEDTPCPD